MLLKIYQQNPSEKYISQVVEILRGDGVIIMPTETVYTFVCSIGSPRAIDRLKIITGCTEADMVILCSGLDHIADYAKVSNPLFKVIKRNIPGPFIFRLPASSRVPSRLTGKRKEIAIRIADSGIAEAILHELDSSLVMLSRWPTETEEEEYRTDPELINEEWGGFVDLVIDSGIGGSIYDTEIGFSDDEAEILREGAGEFSL